DWRLGLIVWGRDDRTLYLLRYEWKTKGFVSQSEVWERYDVDAGSGTPVGLPPDHHLHDVSPDGKTLLVTDYGSTEDGHTTPYLIDAATHECKRVTETPVCNCRFSPDGKKFVGVRLPAPNSDLPGEVVVVHLADGRESVVRMGDDDTVDILHALW